jgi:fatty acid amide hydrolase
MVSPVLRLGLREISRHLQSRELSSLEVTDAFLARLAELQATVRPVAVPLAALARTLAKESDARRAAGDSRGPFDGVPITLKENIDLAGQPSTLGLPSKKGTVADRDAVVTAILRDSGAVFLAKTNVSQALLFHECRNPLYGQTHNPYDPARTPGGSSGGEAAAIAAYGSPGGIGSDVGGSIRVPCAWTGICGLKPTTDRWSTAGSSSALAGQEIVRGQLGPMARTVDDLAFLLEIVSPARCAARDPRCPPFSIRPLREIDVKELRVGFYTDDGIVRPSPAVERAVHEAAAALRAAGAHVEHFTPFLVEDALFTYFAGVSADGAATLRAQLATEDVDIALHGLLRLARLPPVARRAASLGLSLAGERHISRLVEALGEKTVAGLWKLTRRAREIAIEVMQTWDRLDLDVVICPPHATPALPHTAGQDFVLAASASIFWNFVNFPAGVVPVTTVRADETSPHRSAARLEKRAASVDSGSAGLPVGVQVVARPYREENALAVMALIERVAARAPGFPRFPLEGPAH